MLHQLAPVVRRVDVDLDDAGVGCDLQQLQARVARGRIAFEHDLHAQLRCGGFDRGHQVEVVLQTRQRRHEDIQHTALATVLGLGLGAVGSHRVSHLHAKCSAGDPVRRLLPLRGSRRFGAELGVRGLDLATPIGLLGTGLARAGAVALPLPLHRHHAAFGKAATGGVGRVPRRCARSGLHRVVLGTQRRRLGQGVAHRVRVLLDQVGIVGLADPGQRVQRQAITHRRITGEKVHALVAEEPRAGGPQRAGQAGSDRRVALQRQHVADHGVQPLGEDAAQADTLHLVLEPGFERVHVDRQAALAPQVVPGVFVAGLDEAVAQAELARQGLDEPLRILGGVGVGLALVGKQRGVVPDRLAVGAPADRQCPARQLLAGVPLALSEVQEAALAVFVAQLVHQLAGQAALGRAQGVGVPFRRVAVVHGHEGGLAAHGQSHVAGDQLLIDPGAQGHHVGPLFVGVGQGDTRRLVDSGDLHVVGELDLALVHAAFDGRGTRRGGRAGQRDVPFTGQQARGGVQAHPAGARQVDLTPGVQVGEIDLGAAGAVQALHVGGELDQVAGYEARCQAAMAQQLHQQPARVAAGAGAQFQRLLGRLHARLHADRVVDVLVHHLVQIDQEDDAAPFGAVDLVQVGLHQRGGGLGDQVGCQLLPELGRVGERELLGVGLEEEVERVVDGHLDHQVHRDLELGGLFGKHQTRLVVGKRVLLPVDEVARRLDLERVRNDVAAAVRCGAQADHLRPQRDRAVIFVMGDVVQGGVDGHARLGWVRINRFMRPGRACAGLWHILARPEPIGAMLS